jgi:uncharacterized protein
MPVRSSTSRVLRWPDAAADAVGPLCQRGQDRRAQPQIRSIGYFGSYARGDWGPGSDLDLVVVSDAVDPDPFRRAAAFDTAGIPVPVDVLVYTPEEFERLCAGATGLGAAIRNQARWL